jgi:probable selenium-dependent hydroxylase accessory protein YqeC
VSVLIPELPFKVGDDMKLSEALGITKPSVVSCVGAGGKTSCLLSLAAELQAQQAPFLLTATTKMFYSQVEDFTVVFIDTFSAGVERVHENINRYMCTAWFTVRQGEKIIGLPPEWIDMVFAAHMAPYILVEADGARGRLLKVPNAYEPVVPDSTTITVGVLNMQSLGQGISSATVHRPELVTALLHKGYGESIEPKDIAKLACHEHGILRACKGSKVLLLSGGGKEAADIGKAIAAYIRADNQAGISRCVLTEGFSTQMKPVQVYEL